MLMVVQKGMKKQWLYVLTNRPESLECVLEIFRLIKRALSTDSQLFIWTWDDEKLLSGIVLFLPWQQQTPAHTNLSAI